MKKSWLILLVIDLLVTNLATAQEKTGDCSCCSEPYRQFDFWSGDWDVFDTKGKLVGTNSISINYDDCVLIEKWVSTGKNKGTSINFYDKTNQSWNQVWVDNSGSILQLKGKLENGAMVLKSQIKNSEKGNYYHQISWTKKEDGTVTQHWETFSENDEKINTLFFGIYKKRLN